MNVTCPACKTRYSVDDSRVPPSGVTIKCPKCAHSFVAKRPDPAARGQSAVALPGNVAPAAPPAPKAPSAVPLPGAVAQAPRPQSAVALPGNVAPKIPAARTDPGIDGDLDLGLDDEPAPPPRKAPAPRPTPTDLPGPRGPADLPAPRTGPSDLPSPRRDPPKGRATASEAKPTPGVLDFIGNTAQKAGVAAGGSAIAEYKVRRRNGRVEGPYGAQRLLAMLRNRELGGNEDISEDGVSWRSMTSQPELNQVINELAAQHEDPLAFGQVSLGGGDGELELGDDPVRKPKSSAPYFAPKEGGEELEVPELPGAAPKKAASNSGAAKPADELEVGEIPELPPIWQTYKKPILAFAAAVVLILVGVFTHFFTPLGAFGVPALITMIMEEPPPPLPQAPPPPPAKLADPQELAQLVDEGSYEAFRSVFVTIDKAGPNLPDNLLALAKARGFASLAYGPGEFPIDELKNAVEALNTVDLSKAKDGNSALANVEILKARSALEILTDNPANAAAQLGALVEQRSDDAELALLLGHARARSGDLVGALSAMDRALVANVRYAPALHAIGALVEQSDSPSKLEDAAFWYTKALDANPSHSLSGQAAARVYEALHRTGSRRRILLATAEKASRGLPPAQRAGFYYDLAASYDHIGQVGKVASWAQEAARLDPANSAYVALAAVAIAASGDNAAGLATLNSVLARNPNDPEALIARARIVMQMDDVAKAFIDLDAAKAAAPKDWRPVLWEARFNFSLAKLQDGRAALERAAKLADGHTIPRIELGELDLSLGDVDAAFAHAQEAVKLDPNEARGHRLLATCYIRRGQLDQAISTFEKAVTLDDDALEVRLGYANALRDKGARANQPERSKELLASIPIYLAALFEAPQNPQVLFEYGRAQELMRNLPGALAMYTEAAAIDEKDARPHLKIVAAHLDRDPIDLPGARVSMDRARLIEAASGRPLNEIRYWEARLALAENRSQEAVASMRQAVEAEPRNALFNLWMGKVLERNNSLYEAITYYEKAVSLNSRLAEAHRALGWAQMERHLFDKARASFARFQESAPDDRSIWVDIGETYTRENKDDEALTAFQKAVQADPNAIHALVQIGHIYARRGDDDEATKMFQRAVRADPKSGEATCQLALIANKSKTTAESRALLRKCLELPSAPADMKEAAQTILDAN